MGKDRRIAVAVIGLLALFLAGAGDRAYAVSAVQTSTVTSGQVPTATQWNTYLNRAESWINSNLLNGGTTFTFAEGESLNVLGTLKVDSLRVTGFIDLAAHIIPRISRTYRIGNPTFLLSALHVDTARIVNGVIDSLSGAVVTTSTFTATPATNSTGRLGSNGKRFASVNVDTVRHTVAFDSNDVSKVAPSDVDTANTAWVWGYANVQVNSQDSLKIRDGSVSYADHAALSIDSLKVRASSISGSNLAPVLGGQHEFTGQLKARGDSLKVTLNAQTYTNRQFYKLVRYNRSNAQELAFPGIEGDPLSIANEKEKNTSWYRETLGDGDRGAQALIPTRSDWGITSGQDSVIGYNSDNGVMFIVLAPGANNMIHDATPVLTDIKIKDDILTLSGTGGAALTRIDFLNDNAFFYSTTGISVYGGNIANRNAGSAWVVYNAAPAIVNAGVNAVSVIRDPLGGIEQETGRAKPRVKVDTDGGCSISDAGITAFYDATATTDIVATAFLDRGDMFNVDESATRESVTWKYFAQTIGADSWGVDETWINTGAGSEDIPFADAATFDGFAAIPNASVSESTSPITVLGTSAGLLISHAKRNDNTNGLTFSIDATRNSPPWSATADSLGWSFESAADTNNVWGKKLSRAGTGAGVSYGAGVIGQAAVLDGSANGYLFRNGDTSLKIASSAFTVYCWVKYEATAITKFYFSLFGGTDKYVIYESGSATNVYITDDFDVSAVTQVGPAIDDNRNHFVAGTGDLTNFKFYIDGELCATNAYGVINTAMDTDTLRIGGDTAAGTATNRFVGSVDQWQKIPRALTAGEIRLLYQQGVRAQQTSVDAHDALDTLAVAGVSNVVSGIVATWRSNGAGASDSTTLWDIVYGLPVRRLPSPGGAIKHVELFRVGGQDSVGVIICGATATRIYNPDVRVMDYAKSGPPSPPNDAWWPKHVITPGDSSTWIEGGFTASPAESLGVFKYAHPKTDMRFGKNLEVRGTINYGTNTAIAADQAEMVPIQDANWKNFNGSQSALVPIVAGSYVKLTTAPVVSDNDSTRYYMAEFATRAFPSNRVQILCSPVLKGTQGVQASAVVRIFGAEVGDTLSYAQDSTVVRRTVVSVTGDTVTASASIPAGKEFKVYPPNIVVRYRIPGLQPTNVTQIGATGLFKASSVYGKRGWVVSSSPAGILGNNVEGVAIALSGTVPCWVGADSGAVVPGDALTAGNISCAMKSKYATDKILGYAMEAVATGRKTIKIILE